MDRKRRNTKFKQCFDSVDMNGHHCQFEQSDFHAAGLLEEVRKLSDSAIEYGIMANAGKS